MGRYFIYFVEEDKLNSICTSGTNGLFTYFILKPSFNNYILQPIAARGDCEDFRELIRRNPLSPGFMQDANEIFYRIE